jgi:hypothetical protein
VARRITTAAAGFTAFASLLLPGPTSTVTSATATPLRAGTITAGSVSPEHPIAYTGPVAPVDSIDWASVAYGSSVHLTAWRDDRGTIRVARVSAAGSLLDPFGIRLDPTERSASSPDVAFDGTNFLVTWHIEGRGVVARRVSPSGQVLDPANIVISVSTGEPKIDFDGENYLIVWVAQLPGASSSDIFGRRVSPTGAVVDATDLTISATPADQSRVELAFNGANHLVTWANGPYLDTDIHGTLVDRAGVAAAPSGVPISVAWGEQSDPVVTSVGTSFFVAWRDHRGGTNDIYGTRVDSAGAPSDPSGIAISTAEANQTWPAVASDGTDVLVTWTEDGLPDREDLRFARVDAAGVVLDPSGVALRAGGGPGDVAFDGTDYLVASARGARVSPAGQVLDPDGIQIATAGNAQRQVDMASDGQNTFAVWHDDRFADGGLSYGPYAGGRIYGGRLGPDGEILDGTGIAISTGPEVPDTTILEHRNPAVAFDGTDYLVVWTDEAGDGSRIGAARVSTAGQVLDRFEVASSEFYGLQNPAVSFGGGVFLVAWEQVRGMDTTIRGARVSPAGTVLDPVTFPIDDPVDHGYVGHPAIASDKNDFQVVWTYNTWVGVYDVQGTRVSAAGAVQQPTTTIATGTGFEADPPDIAWSDATYLVVWSDMRNGDGTDIYGTRVNSAGAVVDPAGIAIATHPAPQTQPSVAGNGGAFFVAWYDRRANDPSTAPTNVAGTRVGSDGTVANPDGQVIGLSAEAPAVAPASGSGRFAVAYPRYDQRLDAAQGYLRHVAPK